MRDGRHSRTALLVAGGVVFAAQESALQRCVVPGAAALSRSLLSSAAEGRRLLRLIDSRPGRWALRAAQRCTIPGIVGHWNCRKRWIDDAWHKARDEGFNTLVVAGCGLDTLTLRAARAGGGVRIIEIDHPATSAMRQSALASIGETSSTLIRHDLGQPGLHGALRGVLRGDERTVFVIEGVLMYLTPERVWALLAEIASLPCDRIRLIFTYMETAPDGRAAFRPRSRLIDAWLALVGEPFRSGMKTDTLPGALARHGWRVVAMSRTPGHELVNLELPTGECAVVADAVRDEAEHATR